MGVLEHFGGGPSRHNFTGIAASDNMPVFEEQRPVGEVLPGLFAVLGGVIEKMKDLAPVRGYCHVCAAVVWMIAEAELRYERRGIISLTSRHE